MENSKPTILMVEDNENVLSLNLMLLEQSGKKVVAGRSLAEARELLAGTPSTWCCWISCCRTGAAWT